MNYKELIEKSGMTHEEIADKGGWSTASVYNWKHGIAEPQEENKEKLEKILGSRQNTASATSTNRRNVAKKAAFGANRRLHGLRGELSHAGSHLIFVTEDKKAFVLNP